MSLNRRRWSNELLDSLYDFQSKDSSEPKDASTVEVSSTSEDLNTTQFEIFNLDKRLTENETLSSDSGTIKLSSCNSSSQNDVEEQSLEKQPSQLDRSFNMNTKMTENITLSSDSGTIKLSSCNSSSQNNVEEQSVENQPIQLVNSFNLNARITENVTLSSDSGTIKLSSVSSSPMNTVESKLSESQLSQYQIEMFKEDQINQRFFSSPVEYTKTAEELIAEMNEPDIWDALLELEQALSPVEEHVPNFQEHPHTPSNQAHILNRLSQKFKETPTRFTEKLVSIIEDSIVSFESPTKPYTCDTSGISLHRMTGEFRKLCKFIEDESMPEWAPSLMNITSLDKTETPENENNGHGITAASRNMVKYVNDTPNRRYTPEAIKNLVTPKNKIKSNVGTPINRFTPSADKSFEYWETVCNMMCEAQGSTKKKIRRSLSLPESSKESMDQMLTICERQLASLDDSTIDIRSSEPCKKTDSELKLKVFQAPRSKSVSKMYSSTDEKTKQGSSKKHKDGNINKKLTFDDDYELFRKCKDSKINENELLGNNFKLLKERNNLNTSGKEDFNYSFELFKNKDVNLRANKIDSFENNFELLYSPRESQATMSTNSLYDDNEQDCSLLIELAKRRQRCLDTAKLMMEIDKEDPITNEDNKCLETLYKLGIQDKTFTDVEDDTKFLNTLNHCFEYKNYFRDKSKPLLNMLQKYDSPEDLTRKTTSVIKSKKLNCQLKSTNLNVKNRQIPASNTPNLDRKNSLKSIRDRKVTPRYIPKTLSRLSPKANKKNSHLSDLKKPKITPRVIPNSQSKAIVSLIDKKSVQPQLQQKKVTSGLVIKTPQSDQKSDQLYKLTPRVVSKTSLKPTSKTEYKRITPKSDKKRITPKSDQKRITPKSDQKRITPKLDQKRIIPKAPQNLNVPKISITSENPVNNTTDKSPALRPRQQFITPMSSPKAKLFVTPGSDQNAATLGRKKPSSYFSDTTSKTPTPQKISYDSVKSPISLYINSTDTQLIQNIHGPINDRLLTPVINREVGTSPKLKFKLSSKENKSPTSNYDENIVLPTVRYQPAKNICLIDNKSSYSPRSLTPNSKTKRLLGPIENTVVIRHEGRVIDYSPKSDVLNSETSIRVQKVAEKATSLRKKCM